MLRSDLYITFNQSTGQIDFHDTDQDFVLGIGRAWNGLGKNNPSMQSVRGVGPLPCGWYTIREPFNHPTCGPFVPRLTPDPGTEMFGWDGFLIHGAALDPAKQGQESKGCIVAARVIRKRIHTLGARRLRLISRCDFHNPLCWRTFWAFQSSSGMTAMRA